MKINKTLILVIIVAGIAIYSLCQSNSIKTDVAGYSRTIDSLQHEIDSVENENRILDAHVTAVDNEINKVEGDITNVNKNITIIKNQTHEKVSAVNDYTIHDLIKFFSDRYENGLDSTLKSTDSKVSH